MTASARILTLPLPRERAALVARIERLRQERDRAVREWGYWYGVARTLAEARDASSANRATRATGGTMRALLLASATLALLAGTASADDYVRGYTRRDGTYVAPHYRTSPDGSRANNWSSQGNVNPYTGQAGRADPYAAPSYGYPSQPSPFAPYGGARRRGW